MVVLGVLYTQWIKSVGDLKRGAYLDQFGLHDGSGNVLQLLAINVDPASNRDGVAHILRRHALEVSCKALGIQDVVAMARCNEDLSTASAGAGAGGPAEE